MHIFNIILIFNGFSLSFEITIRHLPFVVMKIIPFECAKKLSNVASVYECDIMYQYSEDLGKVVLLT